MIDTFIDALQERLRADIEQIHVSDGSSTARSAERRLQAVAEHSPAFIALLAEPWLGSDATPQTLRTLEHCARVHLYARILDDALDENLPIYRNNLLRAQALHWEAVQGLSACTPAPLAQQAVQLIAETVAAVQVDNQQRTPLQWGAKNHHLLLSPLLLSGNSLAYQKCRAGLSILIALVQAGDEWRQGEIESPTVHRNFLSLLSASVEPEMLADLNQHGWHRAAQRIVWNARQLLNVLST